jgi:N-acetylglucosaminyldiphosphoundecaprenol N-acetyl-beta-D-mannosaminyltransferase
MAVLCKGVDSLVEHINILGRRTDILEARDFHAIVGQFILKPKQTAYFCNVHMLMLSQEDKALADAMDSANWVFADGVPIAWLQKRLSGKDAKVIRGAEVMLAACAHAAKAGQSIGLLGSTRDVMEPLTNNLQIRFPGIRIVYSYCPPYMKEVLTTTPEELASIKDTAPDWLFVGLGCPKQEKWIATYKDELDCNILGVGAAFDWISGRVKKPPKWMESLGFGWLHRFLHNPRRLWRRYLIYNSKFLLQVLKMIVGK